MNVFAVDEPRITVPNELKTEYILITLADEIAKVTALYEKYNKAKDILNVKARLVLQCRPSKCFNG